MTYDLSLLGFPAGVEQLSQNIKEMTGKKPGIFFMVCWRVVAPVMLTVILVFSIIQFKPARYENYVYPPWAQGIGWLIAMASIIWIPIAAVHTLWVLPGSFTEKLLKSVSPFSLESPLKTPNNLEGIKNTYADISVETAVPLPEKSPVQTHL
ncbi:hypothetical protein GJAV_G00129400 [Gymnothorax javanicus]|nr:hypothetical protein GJAV_G00129400 [Gymnothorax javanicus]